VKRPKAAVSEAMEKEIIEEIIFHHPSKSN